MTDHEHYDPIRVHVASSDVTMAAGPAKGRRRTTFTTIKVVSANANGAEPLLPQSDKRICALINPHTPGAADAHTSAGWISDNQSDVVKGYGSYIVAGGQGPFITYATEALWCASDSGSSTDLWLSITATYEE